MRNRSTDTLRLWPAVAAVGLLLPVRFLVPLIWPDLMPFAIIGALLCGLVVMMWWAFFSRAARSERFGGLAVMIAALVATWLLAHESIASGAMGMLLLMFAVPAIGLAMPLWALASRRLAPRARAASMIATILAATGVWTLVRTDGLTSSVIGSDLHWRWTATAEEKLLVDDTATLLPSSAVKPPATAATAPAVNTTTAAPAPNNVRPTDPRPEPAVDDDAARVADAIPASPEWPGFRGPSRDAVIRNVRIATDWSTTPPVAIWRRPIGPGWSSFAVYADVIYTQEQRAEEEIVSAYKLSTGEPVWAHRDPVRFWESNGGAGPRATPTVDRARGWVYAFGATGILNALDARTGARIWSRDVAGDSTTQVPDWGFSSSPLLLGDTVIVAAAGKLVAYDASAGTLRWSSADRGPSYSSPHVMTVDGVMQVVLLTGRGAMGVAPADGALLWAFTMPSSAMAATIVQPAIAVEGEVLVADGEASTMRRIALGRGPDGWTVNEQWVSNRLKPLFNDFVVHKGHAYGFDGTILACMDVADGNRKWKGGRYGNGQLLLLADQDLLLVTSEDGEMILVDATPDGFHERARIPAIEGKTWNHPALAGDVLLLRNGQEMAAFRLPRSPR